MKVPFFHNNDDYDEVIFYHAGNFFSRDNIHPGMMTLHPGGFTHGPHPKALKNMLDAGEAGDRRIRGDDRHARCAGDRRRPRAGVEWARLRRQLEGARSMKLATLQARRPRRPAAPSSAATSRAACSVPGIAPTLQAALDDWAARRAAAARARRGARAAGDMPTCMPFDPRAMRRAAAARLSVGRRQRLRESCGAGAQGARRRDAGVLLDRSADVPGRLRRLARRARRRASSATRAWGIDLEAEVAVITDDVPMGTADAGGRRSTSSWSRWSTTGRCAT